ncbi:jerky protein homolog-like [Haliotis cracherodii]|uniref:jerky protein homolog-like n=1 Tax=Haliotis cracherodii TaxID=6455 RepID=UPI0039E7E47F
MATTASRSKRQAYTIKDKLEIVRRVREGESQASVSRSTGIPAGTIRGWLKEEKKLQDLAFETQEIGGLQKKRNKGATDSTRDAALFAWFTQSRHGGIPLSGEIVKMQAQKLSQDIHGPDDTFKASAGWLWRFQKRHGIKSFTVTGERRSADDDAAEAFPAILRELMESEGYDEEQIYNCDETGLYYKLLPDKTLGTKEDKQTGFKSAKQRVTVLLTCNKPGMHKLKPLVIGSAQNPRCFHHVNREALPTHYSASANAWMTAKIFEDWFFHKFVPAVPDHLRSRNLEEKAILLLDNCPAHPPASTLQSHDGLIKAFLLPKNTTSLIQLLDQGIIKAYKAHYRRYLVSALVDRGLDPVAFLKTVTVKDAVLHTSKAWVKVTPATINNCWMKGLGPAFGVDEDFVGFQEEDVIDAVQKFRDYAKENSIKVSEETAMMWNACDDNMPIAELLNDQELVAAAMPVDDEEEEEEENSDCENSVQPMAPSVRDAINGAELVLRHLEKSDKYEQLHVMQVRCILSRLRNEELDSQKQSKISDFFSK